MFEKGRLYSLGKDGTKDSLYLNIKNKKFLFGSAEHCTVRIYMDGIFPEHCVLTVGDQGKVYLVPLHPSALILVNGIKINYGICLENNDVLTIFKKDFQFVYPPNIVSRNVFFKRLILFHSKQMKPTQISRSGKSLIKYMSHVQESLEERRVLSWKLYEFIIYLRRLLNKNEECLYDLWPLLEFIWKYCTDRASQDILFLPLKALNLKRVTTAHKKSLESRIIPLTSKNSSVCDAISEKKNYEVSSNCEIVGQKQECSSRKISIYKKRVSLAVKRYHLRKRKSMMMAKAAEIGSVNLELSGETLQMKDACGESNSDEQNALLYLEKQQTTRTQRKRGYKREELKAKTDLKIKRGISVEGITDIIGNLKTTSKQAKEKRRNKKVPAKNLKPGKENNPELTINSSGNQVSISKGKQKPSKEKQISKNQGKPTQECDTQSSRCQRVTRSMTKSRR